MSECPDSLHVRCLLCCQILRCSRADTTVLLAHIRDVHPEVTFQSSEELAPTPVKATELSSTSENKKDHTAHESAIIGTVKSGRSRESFLQVDEPGYRMRRSKINAHTSQSPSQQSRIPQTKLSPKSSVSKSQPAEIRETQVLYKRDYKFRKPIASRRPAKRKLYKTSIEKWRPGKSTIVCPECGANKRPMIKSQVDKVSHSPLGAAFILTCWPFCFLPCLFPPSTKEYLHCAVCNYFLGIYDRKTEVINPNEESLRKTGGGSTSSEHIKD